MCHTPDSEMVENDHKKINKSAIILIHKWILVTNSKELIWTKRRKKLIEKQKWKIYEYFHKKIPAIKQWDRSVVSMVIANFWPKIKPAPKWLAMKICDILATENINDAHFESLSHILTLFLCVSHDRSLSLPEMLSILLTWKMIGWHEIGLWHIVQMRTKKKEFASRMFVERREYQKFV